MRHLPLLWWLPGEGGEGIGDRCRLVPSRPSDRCREPRLVLPHQILLAIIVTITITITISSQLKVAEVTLFAITTCCLTCYLDQGSWRADWGTRWQRRRRNGSPSTKLETQCFVAGWILHWAQTSSVTLCNPWILACEGNVFLHFKLTWQSRYWKLCGEGSGRPPRSEDPLDPPLESGRCEGNHSEGDINTVGIESILLGGYVRLGVIGLTLRAVLSQVPKIFLECILL